MRTLTVYRHGLTMGTPPRTNDHIRALRGEVSGWSTSATRRNLAFLRSVDERKIDATGYRSHAITLTLKDCPASAADWHKIRKAFVMRLNRLGMLRLHWVTEWQRRGVPHLHGCVWLPDTVSPSTIVSHWLALTSEPYGAQQRAQYVIDIKDMVGWLQYLAKHQARGVNHYQRSAAGLPSGWQKKTGRVWGHTGEWPLSDVLKLKLDDEGFYRLRRLCRQWRIADARSRAPMLLRKLAHNSPVSTLLDEKGKFRVSGASYAITSSRRCLKCSDRSISNVRGVSEWIPGHNTELFLSWLIAEGHGVAIREEAQ